MSVAAISPLPRRPLSGATLWELLCGLAVAGVLTGIGVPALHNVLLNARQAADMNAFFTSVQLARSEAFKRARPVVLCKTADARVCGGDEIGYEAGWMVFVNEDDVLPPERSENEPLLTLWVPRSLTIRANRTLFEFRPFRRRSTNGTITFCDQRGSGAARAVIVSYTGRPRVSARGPGNRALVCAEAT
jgi:type IV fimbrial biogenesis protein FimT